MEIQKIPLQKTYEISVGLQSFNTDFLELNKQFNWLKIPPVIDKSNRHTNIYESYNVGKAAQFIQFIAMKNISESHSLTNKKIKHL